MKTVKLKKIAFFACVISAFSCSTTDEVVNDEEVNQELTEKDFFDPEITTYVIDGKVAKDHASVLKVASQAWHIMYDYPNKIATISTTPEEFEKFKNSDADLKRSFENESLVYEEKENVMDNSFDDYTSNTESNNKSTESESSSKIGTFKPIKHFDINQHYSESDSNDIVLHSHEIRKFGNQLYDAYFNVDLYSIPNADVSRQYHFSSNQVANYKVQQGFTSTRSLTTHPVEHKFAKLINHSKKKRKITFYSKANYTGASLSYVLNANSGITVKYHTNFNIPNKPISPSNRVGAKSVKVVNLN